MSMLYPKEKKTSFERYQKPNYAKELADCLNDYRKYKTLCDVILVIGEYEYFAHRNILCAASPYFIEQLGVDGCTLGSRLELTNKISNEVFPDILNFIYIGEICVDEKKVRQLILASDVLYMTSLKELSCRFYEKKLCPANCLSIAALANEFNCESLQKAADKFILQNFLEVSKYDDFKNLTCSHVVKIVSSDDIVVDREEQIFSAVMDWIHYGIETRRIYLVTLFKCIRLSFTSIYFIMDVLERDEELMANEECCSVIYEAKSYLNFPDRRHMFKCRKEFTPRLHYDISEMILVCGGNQERMNTNEVLCYVPSQDFWYPLAPLLHSRFLSASVVLNNEIYCIGGNIEGKATNSVERYCFSFDKWIEQAPFPTTISNHCVCVYNGDMYVIGGSVNGKSVSEVHKYSIEIGVWDKVHNMKVPRRNACVAVHQFLYVLGGYGPDGQPLASVERYNPYENEWSKLFPMNCPRSCASAICLNDNVFVFGGEYGMWSYYRTAEVLNVFTDEWRMIKDMSTPRAFMGITCLNDKIFLVGGMVSAEGYDQYGMANDDEEFVDVNETQSVEYYDITSNTYSKVCSLPVATAGPNCVLITSGKQAIMNRYGL